MAIFERVAHGRLTKAGADARTAELNAAVRLEFVALLGSVLGLSQDFRA